MADYTSTIQVVVNDGALTSLEARIKALQNAKVNIGAGGGGGGGAGGRGGRGVGGGAGSLSQYQKSQAYLNRYIGALKEEAKATDAVTKAEATRLRSNAQLSYRNSMNSKKLTKDMRDQLSFREAIAKANINDSTSLNAAKRIAKEEQAIRRADLRDLNNTVKERDRLRAKQAGIDQTKNPEVFKAYQQEIDRLDKASKTAEQQVGSMSKLEARQYQQTKMHGDMMVARAKASRSIMEAQGREVADQFNREYAGASFENWLSKNDRASGKYKDEINKIRSNYQRDNLTEDELRQNQQAEALLKLKADTSGHTGQTLGTRLKNGLKNITDFITIDRLIHYGAQVGRAMIENVEQIDAGMTELRKVSQASESEYKQFRENSRKSSVEIGTTQKELINSAADWSRLGYSLNESEGLAKVATMYTNIADGLEGGIDQGTQHLVSTLKGFSLSADKASNVADQFNEVGNNFAISSAGIGEAMTRGGATMAAGGNNLSQAIAMVTAANTTMQNPEKAGTAMKSISMALRGTSKVSLAEAGIDITGMATRKDLISIYKNVAGIDLLQEGSKTQFKSTYDILDELYDKWGDLNDLQRSTLAQQTAGKTQSAAFLGMLANWEDAREAYKTALNAEGSAARENQIFIQSIAGRKKQFSAAFESLSDDLINSDMVKTGVRAGTALVQGLDVYVRKTGGGLLTAGVTTALGVGFKNFTKTFAGARENGKGIFDSMSAGASRLKYDLKGVAEGFMALPTPVKAAAGVVAATALAYKIYDGVYTDFGEHQEEVASQLSTYTSAANKVKDIEKQRAENQEQIVALQQSGDMSLDTQAQISSLEKQNSDLAIQLGYQKQIQEIAQTSAAANAAASWNSEAAYTNSGKEVTGFRGFLANIGNALSFGAAMNIDENGIISTADAHSMTMTAQEKFDQTMQEYKDAKDAFNDAMKSGDEDNVKGAQERLSKATSDYQEQVASIQQNLEAVTDHTTGGALKGYETEFKQLRDDYNQVLRESQGDETFISNLLHQDKYKEVRDNIRKLGEDGVITTTELRDGFSDLVEEIEGAGISTQEFSRMLNKSLRDGGILDLSESNADIVRASAKAAEANRANAQAGFVGAQQTGGMTWDTYELLAKSGYGSIINGTRNGLTMDYSAFDQARQGQAQRQRATYARDILDAEKQIKDVDAQIAKQRELIVQASNNERYGLHAVEEAQQKIADLQEQRQTYTENIANLEAATAHARGQSSDITQFMDSLGEGMSMATVTDNLSAGFKTVDELIKSGKVSDSAVREYAQLFSFEDLSDVSNRDLQKYVEQANAARDQFFKTSESGGTEFSPDQFINKVKEAGEAMNATFVTGDHQIKATSSDIMNMAKYWGVNADLVESMFQTLNAYGWDSTIEDATDQLDNLYKSGYQSGLDRDELQRRREEATKDHNDLLLNQLNANLATDLKSDLVSGRSGDLQSVIGVDPNKATEDARKISSAIEQLTDAREDFQVGSSLVDDYGIDVDIDALNGGLQNAYSNLGQLIAQTPELQKGFSDLNIDFNTASVDEVVQTLSGLSMEEILVRLGVDPSEYESYQPEEKQSKVKIIAEMPTLASASAGVITGGKANYDAQVNTNTALKNFNAGQATYDANVNTNTAVSSFQAGVANYIATVDTSNITDLTRKVTYNVVINGTVPHGNMLGGTAHAGGVWGTPKATNALTGEEGFEIVSTRDGYWYTVGDSGAEFADIPKGAVVFNHQQSVDLLKHGRTNGYAHLGGTAYASGSGKKNYKQPTDFDWIERLIKRIDTSVEGHKTLAEIYTDYASQNSELDKAISNIGGKNGSSGLIKKEQSASNLYNKRASSYLKNYKYLSSDGKSIKKLFGKGGTYSDKQFNSYMKKLKNGTLKIESIKNTNLASALKEAASYIDKSREATQKVKELRKEITELAKQKLSNIIDAYDSVLDLTTQQYEKSKAQYDLDDKKGADSSTLQKNLKSQEALQKSLAKSKKEEIDAYDAQIQKQIKSNKLKAGTKDYREAQTQLEKLRTELININSTIYEIGSKIKDLDWRSFNDALAVLGHLDTQLNSTLSLFSDLNAYDKDGVITENGIARMNLLASSMAEARDQVAGYAKQIEILNWQYKNKTITEKEFNSQLKDANEHLLSSANAVKGYKDQIISLIKEGIDKETSAMSKLIDKRKEALQKQKDADNYARDVEKKTKKISKIQSQIDALSSDTTQKGRAKVKELREQLEEAKQDLEDARKDHAINVYSQGLDEEMKAFQEAQDKKVEDLTSSLSVQDQAIKDALNATKDDYSTTYKFLSDLAKSYGISLEDSITKPWQNAKSAADEYKNAVNTNTKSNAADAAEEIRIQKQREEQRKKEEEAERKKQEEIKKREAAEKAAADKKRAEQIAQDKKKEQESIKNHNKDDIREIINRGASHKKTLSDKEKETKSALWKYIVTHYGRVPTAEMYQQIGKVLGVTVSKKSTQKQRNDVLSKMKKLGLASGAYSVSGGWRLTDEEGIGSEAILTKEGVLRQLQNGDTVFNAQQRQMLWKISKMDIPMLMNRLPAMVAFGARAGGGGNVNVSNHYDTLLTVNGNVDRDLLPSLEDILKKSYDYNQKMQRDSFKKNIGKR